MFLVGTASGLDAPRYFGVGAGVVMLGTLIAASVVDGAVGIGLATVSD